MALYQFASKAEHDEILNTIKADIAKISAAAVNPDNEDVENCAVSYAGLGYLNPYKIDQILTELGYESQSADENGWEGDYWIRYTHGEDPIITLYYEAWDFDLKLIAGWEY